MNLLVEKNKYVHMYVCVSDESDDANWWTQLRMFSIVGMYLFHAIKLIFP